MKRHVREEMNALVAEKVMGFRWRKTPKDINGQNGGDDILVPHSIDHNTWNYPPKGKIAITYFVPNYSTDIAAAFEVEKELSLMEGHVQVGYVSRLYELLNIPHGKVITVGQALKLIRATPEQRCRAALRSVGVAW